MLIAAANPGLVYVSQNFGVWWVPQTLNGTGTAAVTAVVVTPDGTAFAATVDGVGLFATQGAASTGTTSRGTGGYIQGGVGTSIELQYLGNGQWQSLSHEGKISGF